LTPSDSDHDGVGDLCDPHPQTPGDAIALFEGFHHPLPPGWTTSGGAWAVDTDDLVSSQAAGIAMIEFPRATTSAGVTLRSRVRTTSLSQNNIHAIGIVDGGTTGLECSPSINGAGAMPLLLLYDLATAATLSSTGFPWGVNDETDLSLRTEASAGQPAAYCQASDTLNTTVSISSSPKAPGATFVLRTRQATARFHWVMVISSP
jgi:hypothetical protein